MQFCGLPDLELWLTFLERVEQGVDMNLVISQIPDCIIRSDACQSDVKAGVGA